MQDAEWVDMDEPIPEIGEAEAVIDKYRAVYDGSEDSVSGYNSYLPDQSRSFFH